jgi:hypothetical protein
LRVADGKREAAALDRRLAVDHGGPGLAQMVGLRRFHRIAAEGDDRRHFACPGEHRRLARLSETEASVRAHLLVRQHHSHDGGGECNQREDVYEDH